MPILELCAEPGETDESLLVLILGLGLFFGLHLLREMGLRDALAARLGPGRYKGLISLGVLASVYLIVEGKTAAPFIQVWVPPYTLRSTTHLLMISSCILVAAGILPPSRTRELVGHPMLVGIIVWGVSHLLSNGDLASLILFGSFSLWAALKIVSLERIPGARRNPGRASLIWDAAAVLLGMIAYSLLLVFHGPLFGFALLVLT